MADILKPGNPVTITGVYKVVHDKDHIPPHHVTAICGGRFPGVSLVMTGSALNSSWRQYK